MYLDPSFGGMLIQIIVAVFIAGGAVAFGLRKKIKALFRKKKDGEDMGEPVSGDPANAAGVIDVLDED